MGLELLYDDPAGFARRDAKYFKFTIGVIFLCALTRIF